MVRILPPNWLSRAWQKEWRISLGCWGKSSQRRIETMYLPLRRIKRIGRNSYCKKMILSVPMLENPHHRATMPSHYPGQVSVEHTTTLTRTPEVHGQGQTSAETFKKTISCVSACVPVYLCVSANISMYVHMHAYEYVNVCAPVHGYVSVCVKYMSMCTYVYMYVCMCRYAFVCAHVNVYAGTALVCVFLCVYIYIHMLLCAYMYAYLYLYLYTCVCIVYMYTKMQKVVYV